MPEFDRELSRRISRFMQLPRRSHDTWQGAVARLPLFAKDAETKQLVRQSVVVWVNLATDAVSRSATPAASPGERERVLEAFVDLGLRNRKVREGRPARLEVQDESLGAYIKNALADGELEVAVLPTLPRVSEEVDDIIHAEYGGPPPPGALDAPGVTVERMRAFADAARHLHVRGLWNDIGREDLIVVEEPAPPDGLGCFVVTDDDGLAGLEFYWSPEQFDREAAEEADDEIESAEDDLDESDLDGDDPLDDDTGEGDDGRPHWRVDYVRIDQLPVSDVELWADEGLPVAGPEAYPVLIRAVGFREHERAEGGRLAFVEGLLRALADTTEDEIDTGVWTHTVGTADGRVTYRLSMPSLRADTDEDRQAREEEDRSVARLSRFFAEHMFEDMEEALAEVERLGPSVLEYPEPRTPAERAQDLVFRSGGAAGRRRTQLLRQAFAISPDCVDACVQLGEISRDPARSLALFEAALAAGARAIPAELLAAQKGNYWGHALTRALLRARFGRATTLRDFGRLEDAAGEFRTLLELDEADHGAAAPYLLALLLESGGDAEASDLLSRFDHEGPEWAYGRTLWEFRNRSRQDAGEALQLGLAANPRVARLLTLAAPDLDAYPEPDEDDSHDAGMDDDAHDEIEEGIDCAALLARAWRATPGAIEWLGEELTRRQRNRSRRGRSRRRR